MDICLVTMPFASVERPSMALGMLKGALTELDRPAPPTRRRDSLPDHLATRRRTIARA